LLTLPLRFPWSGLTSALKFHETGRARILAVASLRRISGLPDIPTLDEIGLKGFQSGTWNAIVASPGTPPKMVVKLNKTVNKVLHSVEVKDLFAKDKRGRSALSQKRTFRHRTPASRAII
jgi:tripartite-type tricarboxylate transporter receptor subunit TctC